MSIRTSLSARLQRLVILIVLLVIVGTSAAAAYWTAQAQVEDAASAASIGLEQDLLTGNEGVSLTTTYGSQNLTAAGAVSITNSGSREATVTLDVGTIPTGGAGLASSLQVSVAPVASVQECTPGADLPEKVSGSLPMSDDGHLEAGATLVLCVQTSIAPAGITAHAGEEIELTLASTLTYADAEEWILEGPTESFVQQIEPDPFAGAETMTCETDGPWEPRLGFTHEMGWEDQDRIQYRVFLAHENSSNLRVAYPVGPLTGWYTTVHVKNSEPDLRAFMNSKEGGMGNAWVYVEAKFPEDQEWTPAAAGKIHTTVEHSTVAVYCGWR